ncbi:MAG: acyl carrier protein [Actinomycetota bacterium]|jgi:acyl carrier protein|nr:acyl carrier protein [Actinomycetota bacterium]
MRGDSSPELVLEAVTAMIGTVVGEDYLLGLEVGMDTSFDQDLEIESIEFVALSEKLMEHYGEQVDFVAWLGGMELEEIMGLTVGRLVDYIVSCTGA